MSSSFRKKQKNYTKVSFVDLVKKITPQVYEEEDLTISGLGLTPFDQIINSHLRIANNISNFISLSSIPNSDTENLNNVSGISKYFVKQNELTRISPYSFESNILLPLGTTMKNFSTSSSFESYLSSNLLPLIIPASETDDSSIVNNISTLSALVGNTEASSIHNYLADTLGWFYFLNTSAEGGLDYSPSSYVLSSLNRVYTGETLETVDGIKGLVTYVWRNYETCSTWKPYSPIPTDFVSGTADAIVNIVDGPLATYTSGIQKLENLLTLVDAVYSNLYIDKTDFKVRDAFEDFINSESILNQKKAQGPLTKFQTILGLGAADFNEAVEKIGLIYDLDNVDAEGLQRIAELIGWKLRGISEDKWRYQLRNAIDVYKKSGTLEAIQTTVNNLIVNSSFDVSGKASELWESYIPFLIWYSLATESDLFLSLNTWTQSLASQAGIQSYSFSSLEENIKIVTDTILLRLYKLYPDNFTFNNKAWDPPRLYRLNQFAEPTDLYTVYNEDFIKPFHIYRYDEPIYNFKRKEAQAFGEILSFDAALTYGPLGYGVYAEGEDIPTDGSRPKYLSATGDLNFVYSYRGHYNYPVPPFEEIKYYKDCTVTEDLLIALEEQLACFGVREAFARQVRDFITSACITDSTNLTTLNEFLMFFSSMENPPNYEEVITSNTKYNFELFSLWNGKSSHLFLDFDNSDFNFTKNTLEADGRYALKEAAQVANEFSPAHTIIRTNLNASDIDDAYDYSSVSYDFLSYKNIDSYESYTSAALVSNFEQSGVSMSFANGGGDSDFGSDDGRGGLNTFKRDKVDSIFDTLAFSADPGEVLSTGVNRRALRRRNYKYLLPKNGYYDRTGFNGPVSFDPSVLEKSTTSSLGEFTLGYVVSSGQFYPIVDPISPSGVWNICEGLNSEKQFFGVYTSATFPYRGLSSVALNNNEKIPELSPSTTKYNDRGQLPYVYQVMHNAMMSQASAYAENQIELSSSAFDLNRYWKNNIQSIANQAVADGYVLNSYNDYLNFSFGSGLHKLFRDYNKHFEHDLGGYYLDKTGGSIFGHTFGRALFNCNFKLEGENATTAEGSYIASSFASSVPLAFNSASGVFSEYGVTNYGSYIASDSGDLYVPRDGSINPGGSFQAEFRNATILSGVEFVNTSGVSVNNSFRIYKLDDSLVSEVSEPRLIENTIVKCKSVDGLPRIRFDVSAYGEDQNTLIKDHRFKLTITALFGDEKINKLGGGKLGVWIHTDVVGSDTKYFWSWTRNNKWELIKESEVSIEKVTSDLAIIKNFALKTKDNECFIHTVPGYDPDSIKLSNIVYSDFEPFEVNFDTRNFTIFNNFEYLDVIPVPERYHSIKEQVHLNELQPTNYIIEIFAIPQKENNSKFLLIEDIQLQDLTLRDWAAVPLGFGTETNSTPLRRFVKEKLYYLSDLELLEVLKFYNGLLGNGSSQYTTNLASRDSTITSPILEQSGGSRLNYRIHPEWATYTKASGTNNTYTLINIYN